MPQLTTQKASTRPDIAESMMEFDLIANNAKMIGMELFPVFDAASQAGEFGRIPIEQLLEESKTSRASGSSYGRGEYEFEDDFYATKENGWEEPVDERDKNIYSEYFDAEVVAAERALSKIMINQEKRVSDLTISNASITGSAATAVYSNKSAATPIDDVETAVQAIYDRTGVWPDTLCLSYKLFRYLRQTDQVLNNISASGAGDRRLLRRAEPGVLLHDELHARLRLLSLLQPGLHVVHQVDVLLHRGEHRARRRAQDGARREGDERTES